MKAELVPENGDPPIPITKDLVVLGRRGYCDIVIDHPSLSKRHCVLVKTDGLLVIRDLISTNGTKVKGQKIRWAALLPDDRISVGSYKLRVYLGPDNVPAPSELYQTKRQRGHLTVRSAAAASPARGAPVATFKQAAPSGPSSPSSFPEPSPLEISLGSSPREDSEPVPLDSPGSDKQEYEPLLPILLDDSGEIFDLD